MIVLTDVSTPPALPSPSPKNKKNRVTTIDRVDPLKQEHLGVGLRREGQARARRARASAPIIVTQIIGRAPP